MVFPIPGVLGLIADALYRSGAVKFGAFRLKIHRTRPDLPLSPHYFDCRADTHPTKPGPVPAWLVTAIASQTLGLFAEEDLDAFEAVAAVPDGATPYGEIVAFILGVPLIRLRKTLHPDGTTTIDGVEGDVEAVRWKRALLVEDVVTTAASSAEAVELLCGLNVFVTGAMAVIDREQGGTERLALMNVRLRALFTFTGLVGHFLHRGTIDVEMFDASHAYHRASVAPTFSP